MACACFAAGKERPAGAESALDPARYRFRHVLRLRQEPAQPNAPITDFGHGGRYVFGKPVSGSKSGPFDGNVYGDFYGGEADKTGWIGAEIGKTIVIPEAEIDFDLAAAGAKLAPGCRPPLCSASLARYLRALENQTSIRRRSLKKRKSSAEPRRRLTCNQRTGSEPRQRRRRQYGRGGRRRGPFLRRTLFLNQARIFANHGCRIHVTGPIFLQKRVDGRAPEGTPDKARLLGVGDQSCGTASTGSLFSRCLASGCAVSTFFTRDAERRAIAPQALGQSICAEGKLIAALEDAGRHGATTPSSRL